MNDDLVTLNEATLMLNEYMRNLIQEGEFVNAGTVSQTIFGLLQMIHARKDNANPDILNQSNANPDLQKLAEQTDQKLDAASESIQP